MKPRLMPYAKGHSGKYHIIKIVNGGMYCQGEAGKCTHLKQSDVAPPDRRATDCGIIEARSITVAATIAGIEDAVAELCYERPHISNRFAWRLLLNKQGRIIGKSKQVI